MEGKWDAIVDMFEYMNRVDPNNTRIKDGEDDDNEKTKGFLSHARAIKGTPALLNGLLSRHWKQESAPPDAIQAPFPDEVRKQLSEGELDELAEARLNYAEACIHFGDLNRAYKSLVCLRSNPARTRTFDRTWRTTKAMYRIYKHSKDPRCGADCAELATEALNVAKAGDLSFKVQNLAVDIFYDAYQVFKGELDRNAKAQEHFKTLLQQKMGELQQKCTMAIQAALEFVDEDDFQDRKPPLSKKEALNAQKAAAALHYASILEGFGYKDLVKHIVSKAHLAKPDRILSLTEQLLKSSVNDPQRHACAQSIGKNILDPLMCRPDTTLNDLSLLSQFYRVCCSWSSSLAQTGEFAEKSVSCYAQFAKALDEKDAYLRLVEMYGWQMLVMPNEKSRLAQCKEEARRDAARSCLKQVGKCIFTKEPNRDAAYAFIEEARRIDPDYANGMSLPSMLKLK